MRKVKLSLLALALVIPMLGCGNSKKVNIKELTPEQVAEQEAALKQVKDSEVEHLKNKPKEKSQQDSVDDAERAHSRQRR